MSPETMRKGRGRTLLRAILCTMFAVSLFGVSTLTASAQVTVPTFDPEQFEFDDSAFDDIDFDDSAFDNIDFDDSAFDDIDFENGNTGNIADIPDVPTDVPDDVEIPTALEICQAQFPDNLPDTTAMLEEALAGTELSDDEVAEILEAAAAGDVTCDDLLGGV